MDFGRAVILAPPLGAGTNIDIVIASLATMLEPVRVIDQPNCPRRNDRAAAFALWEQAKSGLLATVVARQENPAALLRLAFQRRMNDDDHIVRQTVRIDSTDRTAASFQAVHSATDFVVNGFRDTQGASDVFLAPDAEVLLDERFVNGYCLRDRGSPSRAPNDIGLAFARGDPQARPRGHRRRHLDRHDCSRAAASTTPTSGSVAKSKISIPVGASTFAKCRMASYSSTAGTSASSSRNPLMSWVPAKARTEEQHSTRYILSPQESGGELAHAAWANGASWQASLGTLRGHATTRAGVPAAGTRVRLEDTDYGATADERGSF